MAQDKDNNTYYIVLENDKSIKQMLDRFYIIPKRKQSYTKAQIEFLEDNAIYPKSDKVRNGKDGFICFRGKKPKKLTFEQQIEILENADLTQRQLADKFIVSVGTINKVLKGKY